MVIFISPFFAKDTLNLLNLCRVLSTFIEGNGIYVFRIT